MNSAEIRKRYLEFFQKRGHVILPSASLVPENDPTTLFTGSGMQPMLPYLLGQNHPLGTRIVDSQKSFRSGDIDEVGDNRHTTFFEMLGNWSFGDYFQEEQLSWIFGFLVDEIKLDPKKLFVTVFGGDKENGLSRDDAAVRIWKRLFKEKGIEALDIDMGTEGNAAEAGMQDGRIFYYGSKNWWSRAGDPNKMPLGEPGGPDSEMFYEFDNVEHDPKYGKLCHPNCDCGRYLEIGNSVFMQFIKVADKKFELLPRKNIDFGGGFERMAAASLNNPDIFTIDIFKGAIENLENLSGKSYTDANYTSAFRIVADHVRASIFLIGDGVYPSNTDRGYFVRRLLRRAIRYWDKLGIPNAGIGELVKPFLVFYKDAYPDTFKKEELITIEIAKEEAKFRSTLQKGLSILNKKLKGAQILVPGEKIIAQEVALVDGIDGKQMWDHTPMHLNGKWFFNFYQAFGFPIDIAIEELRLKGREFFPGELQRIYEEFSFEQKKHQDLSRSGAEKKFKGGLADTSNQSIRYHTATHLLNAALRMVLGTHVMQKGSNITPERMRFDFSHPQKMTDEEKKKVEDIVNEKIQRALPVSFKEIPKEEAEKLGAIHAFGEKYGDIVKVYSVGDEKTGIFSQEFCGGPHVANTSELGHFKIIKEEAVSQGIRRIKAVLE
jgi:alanyl-tRNA synthetase